MPLRKVSGPENYDSRARVDRLRITLIETIRQKASPQVKLTRQHKPPAIACAERFLVI
jgi:hypothetical protein